MATAKIKNFNIRLAGKGVLTGLITYFLIIALSAGLIKNGYISLEKPIYISASAFLFASASVGMFHAVKGRGAGMVIMLLSYLSLCLIAALPAVFCAEAEISIFSSMIIYILGFAICYVMSILKIKNSKLHKRRRKR